MRVDVLAVLLFAAVSVIACSDSGPAARDLGGSGETGADGGPREAGRDGGAGPARSVYAWFPRELADWNVGAIDWSAITHLCFRSVEIQADGSIKTTRTAQQVQSLVAQAHARGVKVTVLVRGTTREASSSYLARAADKAATGLLDYVKANGLDGVNLDDETWSETNTVTGGSNRELVTGFFRALRQRFKAARPDYHLSWASPGVISPADRFGEAWFDFAAIAAELDAFTFMAYVMNPPTIGWTTGAQPIAGGGTVGTHARDFTTLVEDYLQVTAGAAPKLLLGMASDRGGTEWDCETDEALSPIVGAPRRLTPAQAEASSGKYGRLFHPLQRVPWYRFEGSAGWVQGWYEDDESLAAKLELASDRGLGGVSVWVLDGSAEPPSTFKLLKAYLGR